VNKNEQRTFGITENLLRKPVPMFYGAGDHKVQLAYITPDEAELLSELDLHGSNPPNPGPEGIPNFNDPAGASGPDSAGMSGVAASAGESAARGDAVGRSDASQAAAEGVGGFATGSGGQAIGSSQGAVTQGGLNAAQRGVDLGTNTLGPAFGLMGQERADAISAAQPSFGKSFGNFQESLGNFVSNLGITKGGIMGSAIAAALGLGPFGAMALGQIGKSYSDKPEGEPGFFGQLGQNVKSDLSSMFGKAPEGEERSLMDRLGIVFGPADPNVDDKGGNREPVVQELATMDVGTIEKNNIIREYIAKGYPPDLAEYLYEALHANA